MALAELTHTEDHTVVTTTENIMDKYFTDITNPAENRSQVSEELLNKLPSWAVKVIQQLEKK